ncbi:MAG: CBS domain-containing protein [Actinomycetota bacterium]|nr:CBS domain-containing protein [Actinomycetota bacterium]
MAETVREVMSTGPETVGDDETILEAARRLAEANVGALPIIGANGEVRGMLTDRDIAVRVVAQGRDPGEMKAGALAQDDVVTVSPDDSLDEALKRMTATGVRRLPVVEGEDLVGVVSQADLARALPQEKAGALMDAVSASTV